MLKLGYSIILGVFLTNVALFSAPVGMISSSGTDPFGTYVSTTTTTTPVSSLPWVFTGLPSPVVIGGVSAVGAWQRLVSTTVTTRTIAQVTSYASDWDKFWNINGTPAGPATSTVTVTTSSFTETVPCFTAGQPPVALPPPTTVTTIANASIMPPPDVPGVPLIGFLQAAITMTPPDYGTSGTTLTVYSSLGAGFQQGASILGQVVAGLGSITSPPPIAATLQADFQNLQSAMNQVGLALQAGVPNNPIAFLSLAGDLNTLSNDFGLLQGGGDYPSDYVDGAGNLRDAAGLLDNAATLISQDLTVVGAARDLNRTRFFSDMVSVGQDYEKFVNHAATPEPSTLVLFGVGCLSIFGYRWRRRNQSSS